MSRDVRRENTDRLIALIEEGNAPWQRDEAAPTLQVNAASGNAYNGMNQIMLGADNTTQDPRWVTYEQAQKQGWQVQHGSRGRPVEYFTFGEDDGPSEGKAKNPQRLYYTAFHASRIEGMPEYQPGKPPSQTPEERAKMLESAASILEALKAEGANIRHDQTDRAFYRAATDTIHLPPPEKFQSRESYYSTALHEAAKWTGHSDRTRREYGRAHNVREEFRADLASYQLAMRLGLPLACEHRQEKENYKENLIELLKEDKNELARAARDAGTIAAYILDRDRTQNRETEQTQAGEREEKQNKEQTRETARLEEEAKLNVNKQALDEAGRVADYISSLERSHDRTRIAGQHIDPHSPEAFMIDAADGLKSAIHALKKELDTREAGATPSKDRPPLQAGEKIDGPSIVMAKTQAGKAAQILGKSGATASVADELDDLNRGDVYNQTRDKIDQQTTTQEQAKEQDKTRVIEAAQKEQESAQIKEADSERKRRQRPYNGVIVAQGAYFFAQKVSDDIVVLHDISKVTEIPEKGIKVSIQYENGVGRLSLGREKSRSKENERSLSLS